MRIEALSSPAVPLVEPPAAPQAPRPVATEFPQSETRSGDQRGGGASAASRAQDVEKAVGTINDLLKPDGVSMKFTRDADTRAIVIELVDDNTGETVSQIPDKAILRLAAALDRLTGKLFSGRA
jgi:uncharacterized FlaG/YvyC family protein